MPNSRYSGYQYETSPRKIKPEYEPQQKKKNSNKTGNNNKNKTSTAKKKTTSANTKRKKHVNSQVKVVSYVLLGFVILLAISYRNSLITESFNKKEQLKSDLAVIEKENQQLEVNIQNSLNLSNIEKAAKENGFKAYMPDLKYCTDNAAMIGSAAHYNYVSGKYYEIKDKMDLNAIANIKIGD